MPLESNMKSTLFVVLVVILDVIYGLQCYMSEEMTVTPNTAVEECTDPAATCRIRMKLGQDYWRRGCDNNPVGCTSFLETNPDVNVTICNCDTDLCNEYNELAILGSSTPEPAAPVTPSPTTRAPSTADITPSPDMPTTASPNAAGTGLQCYMSEEMTVSEDTAVEECSDVGATCRIRMKLGQNYWRRGCDNAPVGCSSFLETNPTVNVTICNCDTNLCNQYNDLAVLGSNTSSPTTAPTGESSLDPESGALRVGVIWNVQYMLYVFIALCQLYNFA